MRKKLNKSGKNLFKRVKRVSKNLGEDSVEHIQENVVERLSHVRHVRLLILEWSLLVIAIIFFAITQAFWYSESYAINTYVPGGTYAEATYGEISSLNPLFASTSSEKTVSKLLFASLASTDYTGHTGLDLASSITHDDSAKVYTVKLKDDLKWSDGQPLTVDDVIFTTDLIKNESLKTSYSSNLAGVNVEKVDDSTIKFSLKGPNAFFASALEFPILPKHILKDVSVELLLENSFSAQPIGSGPFAFKTTQAVDTKGEKIIYLVRNDYYHKGKALLENFSVHAYVDTKDIVNALNSGTVTASADVSTEDINNITSNALSRRDSALNYGVLMFINMNSNILKEKDLRKALQTGIDMSEVRSVLSDEPELNYPITSSQIGDVDFPKLPKFDQSAAIETVKKYKATNGYNDQKPATLRVVTVKSGLLPQVADKIVEQLKVLGFDASSTVYEPNQDFTVNVLSPRNYDILVYEVGFGPDPDVYAYYHSSEATSSGHNLSNYKNSVSSDILLSARTTSDAALRDAKYGKFVERWLEDVPAIGIYQTNLHYFVNNNARTFSTENKLVYAEDRFSDVNRWASQSVTKNRTP